MGITSSLENMYKETTIKMSIRIKIIFFFMLNPKKAFQETTEFTEITS